MLCLSGPLHIVPPAMDLPWNTDEKGLPRNADLAQKFKDQKDYGGFVKHEEAKDEEGVFRLSEVLKDSRRQQLATAMRLY